MARLLFACLCLLIAAEILLVAGLVSFTLLRLTDDSVPRSGGRSHPAFLVPLPGSTPRSEVNVWDHHGPLNVLLIGLDADDCAIEGSTTTARRADTIIVVRVDPRTSRAAMLSIPRDLYVAIPGHGARKINTAHVHGELDEAVEGGGPALLARTIEENLDIPIHRYARIDFEGFRSIVDAVGGVDIDVPPSRGDPEVGLYDADYPDGHCGVMTVSFAPGPQHMDGERALQYARSRKTTSDFDRSRRQMQVLLALRDKATSLAVFASLPRLVPALLDTVATDFTPTELASLARLAAKIDAESIPTFNIDQDVLYDEMLPIDGVPQSILRLEPSAFEQLRQSYLDMLPPTPTPEPTSSTTAIPSLAPSAGRP